MTGWGLDAFGRVVVGGPFEAQHLLGGVQLILVFWLQSFALQGYGLIRV